MTASFFIRLTLGSVVGLLGAAVPALAQHAAPPPISLARATVTLSGTSNLHDYTASTSTVRVTQLQLASDTSVPQLLQAVVKPGALQAFELAIAASTLHSTREGLDKNMHKALKVKAHADIVFRLTRVEHKSGVLRAVGVLRVAGVEKEVGFDITTQQKTGSLVVSGSVDLLMTDFGIPAPKAMMGMLRTDPKVTVAFEAVLSIPLT